MWYFRHFPKTGEPQYRPSPSYRDPPKSIPEFGKPPCYLGAGLAILKVAAAQESRLDEFMRAEISIFVT